MNVPCKDCPNRQIGCHSKCEKYQEYARFCEEQRQNRLKESAELETKLDHNRKAYRRVTQYKKYPPF